MKVCCHDLGQRERVGAPSLKSPTMDNSTTGVVRKNDGQTHTVIVALDNAPQSGLSGISCVRRLHASLFFLALPLVR
jgi:hypothetical protein